MSDLANYLWTAVVVGAGATAMMDIAAVARQKLSGTSLPDYGLVGRWVGHMARGRFHHVKIAASAPISGELKIGWTAHYLIGIAFAGVLLAIWGLDWSRHPTIGPALIVGIGSVAAPILLMQPGMGLGLVVRLRSLVTHAIFGLGLYATAWLASVAS